MRKDRIKVFIIAGLLVLGLYILFFRLGSSSLISSEATHAMVSRCILEQGRLYPMCVKSFAKNKAHLYCGGKEPLKFWAEALLFKLTSPNEWTARIIDASLGMATLLLLIIFGGALLGWEAGALAALMVLAFPPIVLSHCFRSGTQDSLLVFSYSGALLGYAWYRIRGGKVALALATLAVMAGLMTKDVFLLSIYPSVALAEMALSPGREGLKRLISPGFLLFFLVPVGWYLAWLGFVYLSTQGACIRHLLKNEFVKPALGELASVAKYYKGPLFYPKILLKYLGPILAAPVAFLIPADHWERDERREAAAFLLSAALCYLVLVSLPALKVKRYIYPIYPVLSLGLAFCVVTLIRQAPSRLLKALLVVVVGLPLAINLAYVSSKVTKERVIPSSRFVRHFQALKGPKVLVLEYPQVGDVDSHDSFYFSLVSHVERMPAEEIKKALESGRFKGTVAIITSHPDFYRGIPGVRIVRVWDMRKRKKERLKYVVLEVKVESPPKEGKTP